MSPEKPYVIVAPGWHAGPEAQVLHLLAHELCGLGLDARLLLTAEDGGGPLLNAGLRAPALNPHFRERWPSLSRQAITVCSDRLTGNPFQAARLLRLRFGKGGQPTGGERDGEFTVYHSRSLPQPMRGDYHSLPLLPLALALFNTVGATPWAERRLELRLGGDGPLPPLEAGSTERAAQLRQTRLLHSHDAASWINLEAIACGAVVLLQVDTKPGSPWSRRELESSEWGGGGFAFADTEFEIQRALATRVETVERLRELHAGMRPRLREIVAASQRFFRS